MAHKDSVDISFNSEDKESREVLLSSGSESTLSDQFWHSRRYFEDAMSRKKHMFHLVLLYITNLMTATTLLLLIAHTHRTNGSQNCKADPGISFYSPGNAGIAYKTNTFSTGEGDGMSIYQGAPNDETDKLWRQLYHSGVVTRLSTEDATLLYDKTELDKGDQFIQLEVFHQLHCVNSIRRSLWPEYYPEFSMTKPDGQRNMGIVMHLDHCVDRLRQGVMCASNVGVQKWVRTSGMEPQRNGTTMFEEWLRLETTPTMTCRDFDALQKWAFEREPEAWDVRDNGMNGVKIPV
ncbi:hypothetical protein F4778DRAFT_796674 [Xylariomycetidae sp. FL2044]|nr:hypothetical protein F4778DRAFT_796674 [Xylariomycetidae sp. FL2044]